MSGELSDHLATPDETGKLPNRRKLPTAATTYAPCVRLGGDASLTCTFVTFVSVLCV